MVDWKENKAIAHIKFEGAAGLGGIRYDASADRALVNIANKGEAELWSVRRDGSHTAWKLGASANSGALAATERIAIIPLIHANTLAIADLQKGNIRAVKTEIAPFGAAINHDSTTAYVTNWGGRTPKPGDLNAPTGHLPNADKVVTDERGIASTGTVSRIDLIMGKVEESIPVGLHPTALVWDEPNARLYVANTNQDTISVIDTNQNKVIKTFLLEPFSRKTAGVAPTALAFDEKNPLRRLRRIERNRGARQNHRPTARLDPHCVVSRTRWPSQRAYRDSARCWASAPARKATSRSGTSIRIEARFTSYRFPIAAQLRFIYERRDRQQSDGAASQRPEASAPASARCRYPSARASLPPSSTSSTS